MHKLIVANYKMNGNSKFYKSIAKKLNIGHKDTKIVLCPPFVYLPFLKVKNKNISLGAQDISMENNKKSTGQISADMLKEFNVKYAIIGHSERRLTMDNDACVLSKINNAISNNLTPIICVGESKKNSALNTVLEQVESALSVCEKGKEVVFAYEPVWAIGSGEVPTNKRIIRVVEQIKSTILKHEIEPICLYGGSVNEKNYSELLKTNIDGFLIGSASLNVEKFIEIIKGVDND